MSSSDQAPATPVEDLREQIASAIDHQIGDNSDVYEAADNVLAVVQPELDRLREQKVQGWNAALGGSNYAAELNRRLDRHGEIVARLHAERDALRAQLENAVVLPFDSRNQIEQMLRGIATIGNPTGTAAQVMRLLVSWKSAAGTPSFKAWIDTSQELAETQREMDTLRDRAVVLPEDWENRISDALEDCDLLAVADWMTARKIVTGLLASWRPSA